MVNILLFLLACGFLVGLLLIFIVVVLYIIGTIRDKDVISWHP